MNEPLQVLVVGTPPPGLADTPWGAIVLQPCAGLDGVAAALQAAAADALLLLADDAGALADWHRNLERLRHPERG